MKDVARELVLIAKELVAARDADLVAQIERGDRVYYKAKNGYVLKASADKPIRGGKAWQVILDAPGGRKLVHFVGLPAYDEVVKVDKW